MKIKNIFWDGQRCYNTEEIEIDLSNGQTIKIKQGDSIVRLIKKLTEVIK